MLLGTELLIQYWLNMWCGSLVNRLVIRPSWQSHSLSSLLKSLLDLMRWLLLPTQVVPQLVRHNNHPSLMHLVQHC